MIRIRYQPDSDCEIAGAPSELRKIAQAIEALRWPDRPSVTVDGDVSFTPTPYPQKLTRLIVQLSRGPIMARVSDDAIVVDVSPEAAASLSSFFDFDDSLRDGYHVHCDAACGEDFVDAQSVPLVMMVSREA